MENFYHRFINSLKIQFFCENFEDGKFWLVVRKKIQPFWGLFKNKKNLKILYLNVRLKILK